MALVEPEAGSRLDQLLATYARVKPKADELAKQVESIKNAIKLELVNAAPGENDIHVNSAYGTHHLYAQTYIQLDSKRMKAEAPDVYTTFGVERVKWVLR